MKIINKRDLKNKITTTMKDAVDTKEELFNLKEKTIGDMRICLEDGVWYIFGFNGWLSNMGPLKI